MRTALLVPGVAGTLLLAGCAGGLNPESSADPSAPTVIAAFYPLAFVADAVAGDHANVTSLARPGIEPHDLELSPSAVRDLSDADLVLYISGFQGAVDDALGATGVNGLDVADVITLHSSEHDHEDEDHADEDHSEDEHDHGSSDPHFWLDPMLLADYGHEVATELARIDPQHAEDYRANAKLLYSELTELDSDFTTGLATCERREIVTSHEAFGYLAEAYELEQIGIAGLDPEAEPSPARLREIRGVIEATGATTIFTESAVNAGVVEALAQDAEVATAVLDPVETIADGDDYISVMTRNLEALREALACE